MLKIEGVRYSQCGYCLNWRPLEEMGWSDELLSWVCCDTSLTPHR